LLVPLSETEHQITKVVVERFVNLQEPTPRTLLIRRFKSLAALQRLTSQFSILKRVGHVEEEYMPTVLAFRYCGDDHLLRTARTSLKIILHILQNLFFVEMDKKDYTPADVEAHASKMFDSPPSSAEIRIGLYLAAEFSVFASHSSDFSSFQIGEIIVEIDPESAWNDYIARASVYVEHGDEDAKPQSDEAVVPDATVFAPATDLGWPIIHPDIARVSKSRFDSEHFADAAEAAFKLINERVKGIVRDRLGSEYDGSSLMQRAFSKERPVIILDDLTTKSGQDIQLGYMQIFSGAMTGIRNPKAHSNVQIDAVRSMHFIYLASLLMSKIDDALALEESAGRATSAPVKSADEPGRS
jgi:uncharacterized protein (TIGR02391 family)